jgi:hypothetical protein
MPEDNSELVSAFPVAVRDDATRLASALPHPDLTAHTFQVLVGEELVRIPYRIYHDVTRIDLGSFNTSQIELLDCLLTRHHDGYVREENLRKILGRNHQWVPPFVLQLVGEYVIEILAAIRDGLGNLDHELYRAFLISNPHFFKLTKQRVVSYRACYYAQIDKSKYAGFEIMNFFDRLIH